MAHFCKSCGTEFHRSRPSANAEVYCSVACRFWEKVDKKEDKDACWNWKSSARCQSSKGYGAFNLNGKVRHSNRVAWELSNGPIPEGLVVCHKCDNKLCCNPSHLFVGTHADNMRDMMEKGRHGTLPREFWEKLRQAKIGKPRPPEVREKLRAAQLGKKLTPEAIAKIVAKTTGQKRSQETRDRMKAAQRAYWDKRKAESALVKA